MAVHEQVEPLVRSSDELNSNLHWFKDAGRSGRDNDGDRLGQFVVVKDDFYDPQDDLCPVDPDEVRAVALRQPFYQYFPPCRADFEPHTYAQLLSAFPQLAARGQAPGKWLTTALKTFAGYSVKDPARGYQYNPNRLRDKLSALLGENIIADSWHSDGDWWNGAFHLIDKDCKGSAIHHHWKQGDVEPRGWSGLIYLSRNAPAASGTSIVFDTLTARCVGPYGRAFGYDWSHCRRACRIDNRFNRLLLFRENVLHVAERGFGLGHEARLTQTFFFRTDGTSR